MLDPINVLELLRAVAARQGGMAMVTLVLPGGAEIACWNDEAGLPHCAALAGVYCAVGAAGPIIGPIRKQTEVQTRSDAVVTVAC